MNMREYGSFSATGSGNGRHGQRKSEVFDQSTLADAQLLFKLVDFNGDGQLDATEFTNHLSDMGVQSREIDGLFHSLDATGDGLVTKQEFVLGYNKYHSTLHNAQQSHAQQSHPATSQSAAIGADYFAPMNHQIVADAQLVFNLADTNGDGKLSSDELSTHLADLGVPAQDIESLIFSLDTNGDNMVSKQEFIAGYNRYYETVRQPATSSSVTAVAPTGAPAVVSCQLSMPITAAQHTAAQLPAQLSTKATTTTRMQPALNESDLDDDWLIQEFHATSPRMNISMPSASLPVIVKSEGNRQWEAVDGSKEAELLLQNAHEFVMMSFDAMAVVAGGSGVVLSSNPAFLRMAFSLGGGDQAQGICMLQQHFLRDLSLPNDTHIRYASQELQIYGDTAVLMINSAIKCMSAISAPSQSLLWVLTARPGAPTELVINDPQLADPQLRVMVDPMVNRRKRPKAKSSENAAPVAEAQKLWQKYGERAVNSHGKNSNHRIMRAYYRCYNRDCPARLTMDLCNQTGNQVDVSTTGAHNHFVTLEVNEKEQKRSRDLDSDLQQQQIRRRGTVC